jgi:hypothetical protein
MKKKSVKEPVVGSSKPANKDYFGTRIKNFLCTIQI